MNTIEKNAGIKVGNCMHPPETPARFEAKVGDEILVSSGIGGFFANIVTFGDTTLRVTTQDGVQFDVQKECVLALCLSEAG